MLDILIVHAQATYPVRTNSWDNLYCFRYNSPHRCHYLNLAYHSVPGFIKRIKYDLIIFHDLFVCARWGGSKAFNRLLQRASWLKDIECTKVVLPQDEFIYSDLLCNFINQFGITHVYSVSPPSEWEKIYNSVDFNKVKFHLVLTGYLDKKTVDRINRIAKSMSTNRPIDIGYRAKYHNPWIGRHGILKHTIAEHFTARAPAKGLKIDISTKEEDAFIGDDWYRFLLRCKYTIGVEGGASILDRDGSIMQKTDLYVKNNPDASFFQVERECFPGRDGELALFAISPRHLEACATRTCQVLIEGYYNGVLEPGKHYIELKKDFSNLEEVLNTIVRDDLRDTITHNAYKDIVESRLYDYSKFVDYVINNSLTSKDFINRSSGVELKRYFLYLIMRVVEFISWIEIAFITVGIKLAKKVMPSCLLDWLKKKLIK